MTREVFCSQLEELQNQIVEYSGDVGAAISRSVDALRQRDTEIAHRVIRDDRLINQRRWEIEDQALVVIATQSPIATDLRIVSSVIQIAGELERMADHAVCLARTTLEIAHEPLLKPLIDIPRMSDICLEMLAESIAAFETNDPAWAWAVSARDREVDDLYRQIYDELLKLMIADPATIGRATQLLKAAHNLERIADRVTNICERITFTATGVLKERSLLIPA